MPWQTLQTPSRSRCRPHARRVLTDAHGRCALRYTANRQAKLAADLLAAVAEFAPGQLRQDVPIDTVPGPAHHYRVEPVKVVALRAAQLPLAVRAQLVDAFDNPVTGAGTLRWSTDEGGTVASALTPLAVDGKAQNEWRGDDTRRWVYTVRVEDDQRFEGRIRRYLSAARPAASGPDRARPERLLPQRR